MIPAPLNLQGMEEFKDCLNESEVFDLSFRGCHYTWSNNSLSNRKLRKLDRALVNEAWMDKYPNSNALFDAPGSSDHSPCLVSLSNNLTRRKCRFMFFNLFTSHPDYSTLISEAWNAPILAAGSMSSLYQKLRMAKICCKNLNRSSFSNIQARTKEAFQRLEDIQKRVLTSPEQDLFEEEAIAKAQWLHLSAAEESFFHQKSRIRWLKDGDSNTGFFHKSVKANLSKNIIHYLRDDNDVKVSDPVLLKEMVTSFYLNLLGSANNHIRLISVQEIRHLHPFRCSDALPISLCNTVYKVIAKIIGTKLKRLTPLAVQRNQVGFVKGRLLCENVLLASELVADFNKPGPITRGCLQIDITKAYDNVDWGFLLRLLEALEIPPSLVSWIRHCITSPHFSVALNGELVGFFKGGKGLRQGDPISSSLFVLVMDFLSKMLDDAVRTSRVKPHPHCEDPLLTHLSFADDMLIFFDGSPQSLKAILEVLSTFNEISGLALNPRKSLLFLDGNDSVATASMAESFGLLPGSLPVKYLGLPLLPHKMRKQDYQPLIDRVTARISSWPVKRLSFAGRLQLIQSVLSSMVNFWAAVFPLPMSCIKKLEQICNSFLWNGAPNSARGAKISWESVCSPKAAGGLGLRRIADSVQVYGLKLIWLIFAGNGSLWVAWVRNNIIGERLIWTADFRQSGSWLWRRVMKLRDLARPYLACQLRSGSNALFWHDDWTGLGPLVDITGANGPRVCGIRSMEVVANAITQGQWRLPRGRHPILILLRNCLPQEVPDLNSSLPDFFLWRNSPDSPPGIFSTSRTWDSLHPPSPALPWTETVWFKQRVPKHAFILWVTLRDRLTTRDKLRSWGINVPASCLLCGSNPETRDHLFFQCNFAAGIWNSFFTHKTLSPPISFQDIVL
ncbi:unnamed protein product [Microthlaspi erraticum]|uniref:Reverse transcriptase domain-containing protein n=1 Tax=Microthlaspi erraticum TaxID=1685480 RepID=A0A6D2ID06_9BRAS|nr:unnamed protein product [Microthlaspi erraticum]